MKKLALTSLLAVFAATGAHAAGHFIGGSATFSMNDDHQKILSIAPEVGWVLNEKWDAGVAAEITYGHKADVLGMGVALEDTTLYGIGGFTRYNVAQFGDVKLLLKGAVEFGAATLSNAGAEETFYLLNASVVPMITYDISESFTLTAELGFLGAQATYMFENKDANMDSEWGIGGGINTGNVANTSDFQIGFLYKF